MIHTHHALTASFAHAWFVLAFAGTCVLASVYGFLQGAWPFGVVEGVWVACRVAAVAPKPLMTFTMPQH